MKNIFVMMALLFGCLSAEQNSSGKLKSTVRKENKPKGEQKSTKIKSEFIETIKGRRVRVSGRFNEFSMDKIKNTISEGIHLDDEQFKTHLMSTKMFESASVESSNDKVDIYIAENPVLGKWVVKVHGAPKPPQEDLEKATNFKKRTHVSPEKIRMLAQQLKNTYVVELATKDVEVNVYEKHYDGTVDLTFDIVITPQKTIEEIQFIGNKLLSSRLLTSFARSRKRAMNPIPLLVYNVISEEDAEEISKTITLAAKARGFLDFKVNSVTTELNHLKKKVLVIVVEEGPRYKVRNIDFKCDVPESESRSIADMKWGLRRLVKGHDFDLFKFNATKYSINNVLANARLVDYELVASYDKIPGTEEVNLVFDVKKAKAKRIIRRIIIDNNNITRDSTIMRNLYFEAGDQLSDAAIECTKARLQGIDLFKEVDVKVIDVPGNENLKDIEIKVEEKPLLEGEVGVNTSTRDVLLNGALSAKTKNLLGAGIGLSGRLELGTMPGISLVLTSPGLFMRDSLAITEFSISEMSMNRSGLFGPSNTIEYIIGALCNLKFPNMSNVVSKLASSDELTQDKSLPFRELDHPISPYWKDKNKPMGMSEFRVAMGFGNQFRFGENHALYVGIGFKNRVIRKSSTGIYDIFNILKTGDDDVKRVKTSGDGQGTFIETAEQHTGQITNQVGDKRFANNGNLVVDVPTDPQSTSGALLAKKFQTQNTVQVFDRGLGTNKVLIAQKDLTEKIEFEQVISYDYTDAIHEIELPYILGVKTTFVTGTTAALKLEFKAGFTKQLNELISFSTFVTYGRSFNNHYLDNFSFRDLGFCSASGPIELYDFNYLGGRSLFKLETTLAVNLFSHHICDILPYVKIGFGSIWDCGIEKMRLPEDIAAKRNWKEHTVDIAQDEFNMIGVFTPGVAIKFGPVQVNLGINLKFMDRYQNLNRNNGIGGLDFSIGMSV